MYKEKLIEVNVCIHTIVKIVGRCDDQTRVLMTLENGSTIGIHTYLFSFSFDILSMSM
jgi:hypothetical protein